MHIFFYIIYILHIFHINEYIIYFYYILYIINKFNYILNETFDIILKAGKTTEFCRSNISMIY